MWYVCLAPGLDTVTIDMPVAHAAVLSTILYILGMLTHAACHPRADAGADTSAVDDDGWNLLEHACATGDWDRLAWALRTGCPLPPGGVKRLVNVLHESELRRSTTVRRV
jgi:hypothetical protein